MKFKAKISDLQKVLQVTLPAIPPKSTLPVLEHLHFTLENNQLRLISTDQYITIMSSIEVDGYLDGKVLVPGRKINEIIKALGAGTEIEFSANPENYELSIVSNTGNFTMKGLNPEEYLDLPELFTSSKPDLNDSTISSNEVAVFKNDEIHKLSSKTSFAVSTDEFRPAMTGVLFQFRDNFVSAVATDSFRLAKAIVRSEESRFPNDLDIIIPAKSVELLRKFSNDAEMSLITRDNKVTHARFTFEHSVFITQIIDERFPPYESVIPANNDKIVTFSKSELLSAIRGVSIQTNTVSKQVKMKLGENEFFLSGRDEEQGTFGNVTVQCSYSGEPVEIGFNYKYFEDALNSIDVVSEDSDTIVLTFNEPTRPVLIKPSIDNDDILMLIMPVRIS